MDLTTEFVQLWLERLQNTLGDLQKDKHFLETRVDYLTKCNEDLHAQLELAHDQLELAGKEAEKDRDLPSPAPENAQTGSIAQPSPVNYPPPFTNLKPETGPKTGASTPPMAIEQQFERLVPRHSDYDL